MRICRFEAAGTRKYGILEGNIISSLQTSPFSRPLASGIAAAVGDKYRLSDVGLLAPCRPSKIVAVGVNYRSHAAELKLSTPPVPLLFLKPSTSVIGPDQSIMLPPGSVRVDYEAELAVVIARKAKDVPLARAEQYILGYTCFNDVTERNMQSADGQWTRAKGFDTFAPIGPWIETEIRPDDLKIETHLNGVVRQSGRTSDLIFGVAQLVSFISGVMTLLPGDVIATGTPAGIGPLAAGDVVEVTLEGIGTLKNPVSMST